jgi:uncharacterized protein
LHIAINRGRAEFVRVLIDGGASMEIPNTGGFTALHFAVSQPKPDIVKMLLCAGARINAQNKVILLNIYIHRTI